MREYYQRMLNKATNPEHIKHYKELIANLDKPKKRWNDRNPRAVYSNKLKMRFDSQIAASKYLGKYNNYCWNAMNGIIENKYEFIEI